MKAWVALLAAAAAMPLLAGCSGPSPDTPGPLPLGVGGSELENGTFYAFAHRGGDLEFAAADNGSADVVLYGADDQRIGHIGVGAEQARGRFVLDGVGPGDLVLHALSVNGTLEVQSRGAAVTEFRALPVHVERHLLVQRDASLLGIPPVDQGSPVDEVVEVGLLRAPSSVAVLAKATFDSLEVSVTGRSGLVHEVRASSGPFVGPGMPFTTLQGESRPENIRDGELTVRVRASGFDGFLVLEARSFSRAEPAAPELRPTTDVPRFTYGELPDQPVGFEVRAGTTFLYLWQEGGPGCGEAEETGTGNQGNQAEACGEGPAHVALFGPRDERVATVAVPANGTLA
ncbi:MAG TPA: hypothetical protein VJ874_04815, partial [Candidatus Thermoplasmatota archaeon]|nr:hypothetical protein [Candidatus Thermoplasmatota archaeon]